MRKRLISVLIVTIVIMSLVPAVSAAEPVTPEPPSWISEDEYIVFPSSDIYSQEAWSTLMDYRKLCDEGKYDEVYRAINYMGILERRSDGNLYTRDPGWIYEYSLLYYKLFLEGYSVSYQISYYMKRIAQQNTIENIRVPLLKWACRSTSWDNEYVKNVSYDFRDLLSMLVETDGFQRFVFLEHTDFEAVRGEATFQRNYETLILIDDRYFPTEITPRMENGRTLVPIRDIMQTIGATIGWDDATRTVTIKRAAKEISMVIGEKSAIVNEQIVELDVAPQIFGGSTYLPIRFVSEQFSQEVGWDGVNRVVTISEDMSFAYEDENIKDWILGCGAILAKYNRRDPYYIGMSSRTVANANSARQSLSGSWSCDNREDVISTIKSMTDNGHAASFAFDAALANSFTDEEFEILLSMSGEVDRYMWPLVKELSEKWGDKGIKAWDWFRMCHLAGWGYLGGYLELEEAYKLVEPVAQRLRDTFSSWEEATENYMDGYAYWSRTDVTEEGTVYKQRLQIYEDLKAAQETDGLLFNEEVWNQPVRGVK